MGILALTDNAKEKINELCEKDGIDAVTLNMKGGGCAGFEYTWGTSTNDDLEKDDEIIETSNGKLAVGQASIMFLIGTTIDYKKEVFGSMFDIQNPNAQSSCGCGVSVNFDMDKLEIPS
jgi:iron-sulfur cluster assembly accessory protein